MSSPPISDASTPSSGSGEAPNACPCPTPPADGGRATASGVSRLYSALGRALDGVLAVALAGPCAACGLPLEGWRNGPVCGACWAAVRLLTPPLCRTCGAPLASSRQAPDGSCTPCRGAARACARIRFAGLYDGALRAILHGFKYDRRRTLARPLAAVMRAQCADVLSGADACVPVPLHWRRRWGRGFNQSEELACRLGLPVVRALRRTRHTRAQASLRSEERWANVRGVYAVRRRFRGARLAGLTIVLVDDVMTTGATLEACARALLGAGAKEVRAVTAAAVVRRSSR